MLALPEPLDPSVIAAAAELSACYEFGRMTFAKNVLRKSMAVRASPLLTWHTADCLPSRSSHRHGVTLDQEFEPSQFIAATHECSAHDEERKCPYASRTDTAAVWIYCHSALGPTAPPKPGVVAFVPGATLFFTVRPITSTLAPDELIP